MVRLDIEPYDSMQWQNIGMIEILPNVEFPLTVGGLDGRMPIICVLTYFHFFPDVSYCKLTNGMRRGNIHKEC